MQIPPRVHAFYGILLSTAYLLEQTFFPAASIVKIHVYFAMIWLKHKCTCFFVCSKAASCWELLGVHNTIHDLLLNANTFTSLFFDLMDKLQTQEQVLVGMTLWSL